MNPQRLLNVPCTIHTVTEGTADAYGDPTLSTSDTRTVCWVDRRSSKDNTEDSGAENWLTANSDLYLPAGTDVTGNDRVTVGGDLFEIIGPPYQHVHPLTTTPIYVIAKIRRVS